MIPNHAKRLLYFHDTQMFAQRYEIWNIFGLSAVTMGRVWATLKLPHTHFKKGYPQKTSGCGTEDVIYFLHC